MYATFLILYLTPAVLPSTFICAYVISASVCVVSVCARCNCDQQLLLGEQSKERGRERERERASMCVCVSLRVVFFCGHFVVAAGRLFSQKGG